MKIIKEKTKYHEYALESEYSPELVNYCKFLKETFGWKEIQWDFENKKWRFHDPSVISMLKNKFKETEIPEEVSSDVTRYEDLLADAKKKQENAIRIKEATTSNLKIKNIKGELYEYQKLGVEFLMNSGGRALLADSPGVGKTAQALAYIVQMGFKRNLIICPASVKFSWESEVKKWTKMKSFIVDPSTKIEDIPFDIECVIINFDILKKFHNEFKKYKWNSLVADECHMIKNPSAIRSKVVKSIALDVPSVIMLTGTPVLSRPVEMFNMLNIIDPKKWNNYYSYATKYCAGRQGYYGFEAKGATNLEELSEKIGKYFLRRTKEQVLKELPPKNRIEVKIDLPKDINAEYRLAEESLLKYFKKYKKNKTNEEIGKALSAEKLVKLNLLREINTRGKIKVAEELIESIVDAGEKVLVFSNFNFPLKELHKKYLNNSVLLLGETNVEKRGKIVKDFQEKDNINIFFGGMKSAGVGITLTKASNVIILDLPYVPADLIQSIDRAHRPGAKYQSLNIYNIITRDSVDSFMEKLLDKKQEIVNKIIGGEDIKKISKKMIKEYLDSIKLKYKKK